MLDRRDNMATKNTMSTTNSFFSDDEYNYSSGDTRIDEVNNPLSAKAELSVDADGNSTNLASELPNMWSWPYIGLYCQYAAVGLLYG